MTDDDRQIDALRVAAIEDLKGLYESSESGACYLDQLGRRQRLCHFLSVLVGSKKINSTQARLLRELLISVNSYAVNHPTVIPEKRSKKDLTKTRIVQAVGVMIRLYDIYPAELGERKNKAAELIGYASRDMEDQPDRNLPHYRKKYIEYIEGILTAPHSRAEVLKPVEALLEKRRPEPSPVKEDQELAEQQKLERRSAVLNGRGLYDTLRALYPSYELLELWDVTHPICVFSAQSSVWNNLESALGRPPSNFLPHPLRWPRDEYYHPPAEEQFNKDVAKFRHPDTNTTRFFPGPTYSLDKLHLPLPGQPLKIDFKFGRFFTKTATSEDLDPEMMKALAADPDTPVSLEQLPMRKWLHGEVADIVVDGAHRDGAVSHATTIMIKNIQGGYDLFLTRRTNDVATHANFSHVCPSGIFSPHYDESNHENSKDEFSVWRNFFREFSEEMYDKQEQQFPHYHIEGATDPADEPEARRLRALLASGQAFLTYTGVSINLLTMRPEICLLLRIEDPDWLRRERHMKKPNRSLKLNWEYHDQAAAENLITEKQWSHWRIVLDSDLRPADGSVFEPSWTVPNAAAAVKLAIDVMKAQGL
ncbi:hypothetical protein ACIBCN_19310 [Nocardia sp. NPDC051052]|uniref:hypothetical protein n=1 Tax=Nocardia sp. NPDC051052 TaxID=3364322 RepID=UPI0037990488